MKTITNIILSIVAVAVFAFAFVYAIEQSEIVHCNKLVSQSEEFAQAGFYITSVEKEMCDVHEVSINAPVR